jgi:hypothetical protein
MLGVLYISAGLPFASLCECIAYVSCFNLFLGDRQGDFGITDAQRLPQEGMLPLVPHSQGRGDPGLGPGRATLQGQIN